MAKKSKPGDGTHGKGIRGASERFESLFDTTKGKEPPKPQQGDEQEEDEDEEIFL